MKEKGEDFTVMPLEGLWYCDNMEEFSEDKKDLWKWKLMILQPENVTQDIFEVAVENGAKKKPDLREYLDKLVLERYTEGLSVQTLYIGAYKDEAPVIGEMHKYIDENGYEKAGFHYEIYIGDPRKTEEAKLKTILRQPIKRK